MVLFHHFRPHIQIQSVQCINVGHMTKIDTQIKKECFDGSAVSIMKKTVAFPLLCTSTGYGKGYGSKTRHCGSFEAMIPLAWSKDVSI